MQLSLIINKLPVISDAEWRERNVLKRRLMVLLEKLFVRKIITPVISYSFNNRMSEKSRSKVTRILPVACEAFKSSISGVWHRPDSRASVASYPSSRKNVVVFGDKF